MAVPKAGDFGWLQFDPQAGHEQGGRRPALVLSGEKYNRASGLMLACPITTKQKGYPFEVAVPPGGLVSGVILVDQIKSVDWGAREYTRIGKCPGDVLEEVMARLGAILEG